MAVGRGDVLLTRARAVLLAERIGTPVKFIPRLPPNTPALPVAE